MKPSGCQSQNVPNIAVGIIPLRLRSVGQYVRLATHRYLSPTQKRMVKKRATRIRNWLSSRGTSPETIPNPVPVPAPAKLSAGDRVRVRSIGEIQSTLDTWGELRHCAFMPEMVPYCDTEQRVFKRLERFLDERDYKVKKASGIVLLEGVMCEGTKFFGQCDRSCFFFWREEWLEKTE